MDYWPSTFWFLLWCLVQLINYQFSGVSQEGTIIFTSLLPFSHMYKVILIRLDSFAKRRHLLDGASDPIGTAWPAVSKEIKESLQQRCICRSTSFYRTFLRPRRIPELVSWPVWTSCNSLSSEVHSPGGSFLPAFYMCRGTKVSIRIPWVYSCFPHFWFLRMIFEPVYWPGLIQPNIRWTRTVRSPSHWSCIL